MENRIAVFTDSQDRFKRSFELWPKNNFIIVRDIHSIRGYIFTGIIVEYGFYTNRKVADAYDILKERQPELFK